MLVGGIVLTVGMLYSAIAHGFVAGYILALPGLIFVATAVVNLKHQPPE